MLGQSIGSLDYNNELLYNYNNNYSNNFLSDNSINQFDNFIQKKEENINKLQMQDVVSDNITTTNNNIPSTESVIAMEKKTIQNLILYRSLYILKRKFIIHKPEINAVYEEYRQGPKNLICLPLIYLNDVFVNISQLAQFTLLPYKTFNELIAGDLLTSLNKQKTSNTLKKLSKYAKENIEKYNMIIYQKRMWQKQAKYQKKLKENSGRYKEIEVENLYIRQYNKRGRVIKESEALIQESTQFAAVLNKEETYEINEEDLSILNSNRYIYSETIPLIIADFLQENPAHNVAVINTATVNSSGSSVDNDNLNEEIRTLFDVEITKKLNYLIKADPEEEKNNKLKNLLFEQMKIDNQIALYEKLIYEKKMNGQNASYLVEMLNKLREQKKAVVNRINKIQNNNRTNNTSCKFSGHITSDKIAE